MTWLRRDAKNAVRSAFLLLLLVSAGAGVGLTTESCEISDLEPSIAVVGAGRAVSPAKCETGLDERSETSDAHLFSKSSATARQPLYLTAIAPHGSADTTRGDPACC